MIRNAGKNDLNAVAEIWKICFGDDEGYIWNYLKNCRPRRTLVWQENEEPVAMLHILPAEYHGAQTRQGNYLYAAATLPDYRGRGIMTRMIDHALGGMEGFAAVLPSDAGLYSFYEKAGFKKAFTLDIIEMSRNELLNTKTESTLARITRDSEWILEKRNENFRNSLCWGKEMIGYAMSEWIYSGGEILRIEDGYAICKKFPGYTLVKELCGIDIGDAANAILNYSDSKKFVFNMRSGMADGFEYKTVNYGMIMETDRKKHENIEGAYANILLD